MAKPNYQHTRRQKEAARKARQQEKLQKKQAARPTRPRRTPWSAVDTTIAAGTNIT